MAKSLQIVGCGHVGKVLGRLWHASGRFRIDGILNRSRASAERACAFIGAGEPVALARELRPAADVLLIATRDDAIQSSAERLAREAQLRPGALAFHVSGALCSQALAPLREQGLHVASVHPVASFADPEAAYRDFAGTYCGIEGDAPAYEAIGNAFEAIGARLFSIDAREKTVYHAGAVIACNYMVTLVEAGLRCYEQAGVPGEVARRVLEPLVSKTLGNVFRHSPAEALSGPIARGEVQVVADQLAALHASNPALAELYRVLGALTLDLARDQGSARESDLEAIARELGSK